jgi:hypothetical protein
MELGLIDGNIFSRPYSKYKHLLSHSWFAVLWQYTSLCNIVVHMNPRHNIKPTRVGDIAPIEIFTRHGYSGKLLEVLNGARKYYRTGRWKNSQPSIPPPTASHEYKNLLMGITHI